MVLGDRKYVDVPGEKTHELPPLLIRSKPQPTPLDKVVDLASTIVEDEDLIASATDVERRKMDLAFNLIEKYFRLISDWQWGDSILEWIRHCESTFESRLELRNLLHADLWPHAGRSSFVTLLADKRIQTLEGVELEKSVGIRLTFRQPPPISYFSNQFLFYLNSPVASSAYRTWATMIPEPIASFPPERFHFQVHSDL